MNINISPENIDDLVKEAIMKAGLGKMVTEAIQKAFSGYNNPIDEQIKRVVGEIAGQLIRERFMAEIKEAVAKQIEVRVTNEIINNTVNASVDRMIRAAEDR